jgi:hypothetical protein
VEINGRQHAKLSQGPGLRLTEALAAKKNLWQVRVRIHACKDFPLLKVDFCGAKWILRMS